jgi:DNA-binding GntR family transcriptional regulator
VWDAESGLQLKLDPGPIPLYHQLEQNLRARIHANEFGPGDALPTEERICEDYGISRITVRRALDALISQGLIVKKRGVGSFVAERRDGVRSVRLIGSLDEFLAGAGSLKTRFLSMQIMPAPPKAAEALKLETDAEAVRLELSAELEGHPVGYLELFFPTWAGEALRPEDIETNTPAIRTIERKLNIRISRAEQVIEAGAAGEDAAPYLGLKPHDPVLRIQRVYYDAAGRAVEAVFGHHHPEHYRYSLELHAGR